MKKTAFVTIGEAPRRDIETTYNRYFEYHPAVSQVGLLDGLSKEEAKELVGMDEHDEYSLISRFADGSSIVMSRKKIEKRLQGKIDVLEEEGYEVIVLLCTGSFETIKTKTARLIEPEKLMIPIAKEMVGESVVGILMPLEEQIEHSKEKWDMGDRAVFGAASPYHYSEEVFREAALKLKEEGAGLIILDCMGYNDEMKSFIQTATETLPIIQSNDLLFKTVADYINDKREVG